MSEKYDDDYLGTDIELDIEHNESDISDAELDDILGVESMLESNNVETASEIEENPDENNIPSKKKKKDPIAELRKKQRIKAEQERLDLEQKIQSEKDTNVFHSEIEHNEYLKNGYEQPSEEEILLHNQETQSYINQENPHSTEYEQNTSYQANVTVSDLSSIDMKYSHEEPFSASCEDISSDTGYFGNDTFVSYNSTTLSESVEPTTNIQSSNEESHEYMADDSQIEPLSIDYSNAEIMESEYPQNIYSNPNNSITQETMSRVDGTITPEGTYVDCNILSSPQNAQEFIFDSRSEESVIQPEKSFYGQNLFIPDAPQRQPDAENSTIISEFHSKHHSPSLNVTENANYNSLRNASFNLSGLNEAIPILNNHSEQIVVGKGIEEAKSYNVSAIDKAYIANERTTGVSVNGNMPVDTKNIKLDDAEKNAVTDKAVSADISETNTGRELDAGEKRKYQKEQGIWKEFCNAGDVVKSSMQESIIDHQETATSGKDTVSKYVSLGSGMIGHMGYVSTMNAVIAHADSVANVTEKAYSVISSGIIKQNDLIALDKDTLKEQLIDAGIKKGMANKIVKDADVIHDTLVARGQLLSFVAANPSIFDDKQTDFIKSFDFFNTARKGNMTNEIMKKYFASSSDPMLKALNPAGMSVKDIKNILKHADKYNLSSSDISILGMLERIKKDGKKMAPGKNVSLKTVKGWKHLVGKGLNAFRRIDDVSIHGINQSLKVYHGAKTSISMLKLAARAGIATKRFVGRVTGANFVAHVVKQYVRNKVRIVKNISKTKLKTVGGKVKTVADKTKTVQHTKRTLGKIKKSKVVQKTSSGIDTAKSGIKTAKAGIMTVKGKARKVTYHTSRGLRKVTNIIKKPIDILLTPFKLLSRFFNFTKGIFKKIILTCSGVFLVVILVYIILVLICGFFMGLSQATSQTAGSVVLTDDMPEYINNLTAKDNDKFKEAENIAQGRPQSPTAFGSVPLYHYGSPQSSNDTNANMYHNEIPGSKTDNGFHIYYLDSAGNVIGNNTTNTKDIISLTAVMLGNDFSDKVTAKNLMSEWFNILNPAVTYVESDIYNTEYATDYYPYSGSTFSGSDYYCNDSSFYNKLDNLKAEGATFYDTPVSQTSNGCHCPGHEESYTKSDGSTGTKTTYCDGCECLGHTPLHCSYGFRDVNVYVTILTKDDVYSATNGVIEYKVPANYECTTFETKSVSTSLTGNYNSYMTEFTSSNGWSFADNCEWCDTLYDQDWFDLYGIDAYTSGVGLSAGATLSDEEIATILDSFEGDVSEARQAFINFGMSNTGKINYYWGGKAKCKGWDGNNFGAKITADAKGRNIRGLDCSGFVSWVYWTTFDVNPGSSTATFTGSLGLSKISASSLKPGDIGLENTPGAKNNHIGIFVGYSEDGRAMWCHCNSSTGNVAVNTTNCFKLYYSLFND